MWGIPVDATAEEVTKHFKDLIGPVADCVVWLRHQPLRNPSSVRYSPHCKHSFVRLLVNPRSYSLGVSVNVNDFLMNVKRFL